MCFADSQHTRLCSNITGLSSAKNMAQCCQVVEASSPLCIGSSSHTIPSANTCGKNSAQMTVRYYFCSMMIVLIIKMMAHHIRWSSTRSYTWVCLIAPSMRICCLTVKLLLAKCNIKVLRICVYCIVFWQRGDVRCRFRVQTFTAVR